MKIAFVSLMGGAPWGGSEALWHNIANYALEQKDEVFASVYKWDKVHPKISALSKKGAIISERSHYNANAGLRQKLIRFIITRRPQLNKEYRELVDFKPDMVFISQGDTFDLAVSHHSLYRLLKSKHIPYAIVCHSHQQFSFIPGSDIYPNAVPVFLDAAQVFFISYRQWALTERRLVTKLPGAHFTWNPLNFPIPENSFPWPDDNTLHFAIVGVLDGSKGHDTAFEVLGQKQWENRNWILNIYGHGNGLKYLEDLAKFYKIDHKVIFHGFENNINKVWQHNHVLLIASSWEGLPISLVEAMACGRPSVVTDVGGQKELVTNEITGFVAPSPTVESFSLALENMWNNKNLKNIGIAAHEKIKLAIDPEPGQTIYRLLKNSILKVHKK